MHIHLLLGNHDGMLQCLENISFSEMKCFMWVLRALKINPVNLIFVLKAEHLGLVT